MDTCFAQSADGTRIAYDVTGRGPILVLLHGYSNNRKMVWHEYGYPVQLADRFTVVTVDLRGCGESDVPRDDYSVDRHIEDIAAVVDAVGAGPIALWGWSFGATIGLHLAARTTLLSRAIIAGTRFGTIFTPEYIREALEHGERLAWLKAVGRLDQATDADRAFAEQTDFPVYLARRRALLDWSGIEPEQLNCPVLLMTGTEDGNVVIRLREQQVAIEAAGHKLLIFDGLNHVQLVSSINVVLPPALDFLSG